MENIKQKAREMFEEQMADLEHERWSKWQKYMHSKILPSEHDAIMQIGTEFIERWERQIATPYSELSEKEKESDRIEVRKYYPFIDQIIDLAIAERDKEIVEMIEKENPQNQITQAILGGMEYRGFYDCGKYLDEDIWERIKPIFINLIKLTQRNK